MNPQTPPARYTAMLPLERDARFALAPLPVPARPLAEHWQHIAPATPPALLAKLAAFYTLAQGAHPLTTQRAWISDSKIFAHWCLAHGHCPLPADPDTIAHFLEYQFFTLKKKLATCERYCATLATMHRDGAQLDNPCQAIAVRLQLKRLRAHNTLRPKQAAPLRWAHIEVALHHLGERPIDLLTKALVCVAYDTLARRSDVQNMKIEDVSRFEDGSGRLRMRRVKNRERNAWKNKYLDPTTLRHVQAWLAWLNETEGYLFRGIYKTGAQPARLSARISAEGVMRAMRRVARGAGIDHRPITSHSCRVGCAQDMRAAGVSLPKMMGAGDWTSSVMPMRYSEDLNEQEGGVAETAVKLGR